jgi:GT2 family glycosyltransferase
MTSAVDVVIGNYNGEAFLADCLESLAAQSKRPDHVFVVDAGSVDGSAKIAATYGATFVEAENRGLGHLYNLGVAAASAPYVFVANNDIALAADCLQQLSSRLEERPEAFAADPRQDAWDTGELVHARTIIRRGPLLRQPIPGFRLDLRAPASFTTQTVCTNAGGMLVRRELYLRLGGFDETFFLDFEDLDLCWRAWCSGWESVHVPEARMRHHVGMSHRGQRRVLARRHAQSHYNLLRWALKCLPARDAAVVVAGELLRFPRHPVVIGRGLARTAKALRAIRIERRRVPNKRLILNSLLRL